MQCYWGWLSTHIHSFFYPIKGNDVPNRSSQIRSSKNMESDLWLKGNLQRKERENHVVNQLTFASRCHNSLQKGCLWFWRNSSSSELKTAFQPLLQNANIFLAHTPHTRKQNLPLQFTCILVLFWNLWFEC